MEITERLQIYELLFAYMYWFVGVLMRVYKCFKHMPQISSSNQEDVDHICRDREFYPESNGQLDLLYDLPDWTVGGSVAGPCLAIPIKENEESVLVLYNL